MGDNKLLNNLTVGVKKLTKKLSGSAKDKFEESATEKAVDTVKSIRGNKEVDTRSKVVDNYILFTGHGGTGASTLVANIANEMANRGLDVIVVDLDIVYPTQHMYVGVSEPVDADLVSALTGESTLGDSIYSKKKYHTLFASNATIVESIKCSGTDAVDNYCEMITKLRTLYDVVLVDAPLKIDDKLVNTALYGCDNIYFVWDEGVSSIVTAERAKSNLALSGISTSKIKAILNKRTNIRYNNTPFDRTGIELVEVLPFSEDVIISGLAGEIFCDRAESASKKAVEFERGIKRLTSKILKIGGYVDGN